jgi:ADP-ribosylglycohydrolase
LPLALCAQVSTEALPRITREEAALTHAHPIAGDGAAVYACLARRLLDGTPWDEAFTVDAAEVDGELAQRLALRVGAPLSRGGFTPDVLVAAIHFVDQAGDFEQALEASLAFAGAANYCPVLVGPLAGLRWGVPEATGYPPVNRPLRARVEGLAERLAEFDVQVESRP